MTRSSASLPTFVQQIEVQVGHHNTEDLREAALFAGKRYGSRSDVLGVAAGTRFHSGDATSELAIQFFVSKKLKHPRRPLPRFVYRRHKDGSIDRKRAFVTDVIEVGNVVAPCGAGARVDALGKTGTITLIFRNRAESVPAFYALTCSHVVSAMTESPPVDRDVRIAECAQVSPFAVVVKNSTVQEGHIHSDLALARLTQSAVDELGGLHLHQADGRVENGPKLTRFIGTDQIVPGLSVESRGAVSDSLGSSVRSFPHTQPVDVAGQKLQYHNLYLMDASVEEGDSGAIVFTSDAAVGVVVARSNQGWAWFQALLPSIMHLCQADPPLAVRCFDS